MNVPSNANNLAGAIANATAYWLDQFNGGMRDLINAQNRNPTTDADKKQKATDMAAAQGQMLAAIQQLAHVDTMESDRLGRIGYNALATLMTDTQKAASDICAKLIEVTKLAIPLPSPLTALDVEAINYVNLYVKILDELARVAPTTIWQQASSSTTA